MANPKKGVLYPIMFPMVDASNFASIESGITASDFNSAATRQYIGVNIGTSTAPAFSDLSKATELIESGIFYHVLNETETNFDAVLVRFQHPSCADQILIYNFGDYTDSDIYSYLVALSGLISDVDSQVNLTATSDYLSALDSNLLSYLAGMSNTISTVYELVSDVDSALTVHDAALSAQVSNAQSAIALLATSNYLSAVHSDLASAIGGVTASVSASDMSDIASRVWATTEGTRVDSRILVIQSMISDVDSQLLLTASQITGMSDILSDVAVAAGTAYVVQAHVSDAGPTAASFDTTLTNTTDNTYADWLLRFIDGGLAGQTKAVYSYNGTTKVISFDENFTSAPTSGDSFVLVPFHVHPITQIAGLAADQVWDEPYSDHLTGSTLGSRVQYIVSGLSDLDSALVVHDANLSGMVSDVQSYLVALSGLISDVDSQVNLTATSNYLSAVHSDLVSAIGNVSVTLTASDISDIASAVADAVGLSGSAIASNVWSEKYNVYSAVNSSFGSFVTQQIQGASNLLSSISGLASDTYSLVSDVNSDLRSYLVIMSGALSDVDSQLNLTATSNYLSAVHSDLASAIGAVTAGVSASDISDIASAVWADTIGARVDSRVLVIQSNVSDIESQLDATHDLVSDVDSQLTVTHNLVSDVDSQLNLIPTTDLSAALANVDSQVTANFNLVSDVDSALTVHDAAVSAAISDLDSQVNANYDLISDVESQLDLTASVVSDIDSQLLVTHSLLSDVESAVDAIWTTALTEAYNADGAAATGAQLLYGIFQTLTEFTISGTTLTVKKLDGSTQAIELTLNDGTSPTGVTRSG